MDDKDSYVRYLQMPGAAPDDTRIWTYDAMTVTVTGTGITDNSMVQLIGYTGDDIAFLEKGAVGILSEAYDTLSAGTLVIIGTYRGNRLTLVPPPMT